MRTWLCLFVLVGGCAPSYDLEVRLERAEVPVGEALEVVLRGTIDAPADASAYLTVAVEGAGSELDAPEVQFESKAGIPSGAADLLEGENSAVNESAPILFSLHDNPEEIIAKWTMVCGTAGEWNVFGGVRLESSDGAPLASGEGSVADAALTCN